MSRLPRLHKPEEIAESLGCSTWWLKEQARKKNIPAVKIAGAWRFTDQHHAEILRQFEIAASPTPQTSTSTRSTATERYAADPAPVAVLTPRTPRRRKSAA
ncbi:DNA-binding protein [Streptomyces sp. NPDC006339]|uniref:DNA-binding protein n=1 Tax=Streptomyces sp. NPDC006339 TaxID=3156755 RepID=UPI0033A23247